MISPYRTLDFFPALCRIEFFAAEFVHESFRIGFFLEAEHSTVDRRE